MKRRDWLKAAMVMGPAGWLAGCYEKPEVMVHEPGKYKGARDPLLEKHARPEQKQRLIERFNLVQVDR